MSKNITFFKPILKNSQTMPKTQGSILGVYPCILFSQEFFGVQAFILQDLTLIFNAIRSATIYRR